MRGGPGSSALRHANPDGPPLPPSALSTAPSRTSGERAQALEEGGGLVAYLVARRQALVLLVGFSRTDGFSRAVFESSLGAGRHSDGGVPPAVGFVLEFLHRYYGPDVGRLYYGPDLGSTVFSERDGS